MEILKKPRNIALIVIVIIAVSAPSSLAIDFAKEYGMTLLAFTRNGKATCYANAWRIID